MVLKIWAVAYRSISMRDGINGPRSNEAEARIKFRFRMSRACYCLGSLVGSLRADNTSNANGGSVP